ncbi:hypothetical protein KSP40_PGU006910 [Platanthera guangdongensis]|uniref:Prolyl endopeptidase n=1 Tax=Platanthera guangdongensis TaxID=2320717 RepID=A0ABR2LNN3_9ASPA
MITSARHAINVLPLLSFLKSIHSFSSRPHVLITPGFSLSSSSRRPLSSSAAGMGSLSDPFPPLPYPPARRDDSVVYNYHGALVPDPYNWLEDSNSEETKAFVESQAALTNSVLADCGERQRLRRKITALFDHPRYDTPFKRGGKYFYFHNSGLQAQSVLYVQSDLDSEAEVLLDPNALSEDGTVALSTAAISRDGSSSAGSDCSLSFCLLQPPPTTPARHLQLLRSPLPVAAAYRCADLAASACRAHGLSMCSPRSLLSCPLRSSSFICSPLPPDRYILWSLRVPVCRASSPRLLVHHPSFLSAALGIFIRTPPALWSQNLCPHVCRTSSACLSVELLLLPFSLQSQLSLHFLSPLWPPAPRVIACAPTRQCSCGQQSLAPLHWHHALLPLSFTAKLFGRFLQFLSLKLRGVSSNVGCGESVSEYVTLTITEGCDPVNKLYYCDLSTLSGGLADFKGGQDILPFIKLVDNFEAQYEVVANDDTEFTFLTNKEAPRYKLVRVNLSKPEIWTDVLVEDQSDVLESVYAVNGDQLLVCYLSDVKHILQIRDLQTGLFLHDLPIEMGTVTGISGKRKDAEIFIGFTSFLTPGVIYKCNLSSEAPEMKVFRDVSVADFDKDDFQVKQVFFSSKDGTKIPMFIVSRKDITLDGSHPTLLYGYGGFNISLTPSFSVGRIVLARNLRFVVCIANIRGGGEYGEEWHKAGSLSRKQNCFDDFIAASEFLISSGYTNSRKLCIEGGSNGGLLVAACINQRPDLFGCALAHVGVMDMLRFHKFTIGHAWTSDYGCSDTEDEFQWLIKYSPLHNVKRPWDKSSDSSTQYPPTMLLTADHDDRVVPLHSLKLLAVMESIEDPVEGERLLAQTLQRRRRLSFLRK